MKYLYIPVDCRPCNLIFPIQLAALQHIELITPPANIMDNFINPSDYDKLNQWLMENCDNDTTLVLSVDNYVFGSLLNSRGNTITIDESITRMNTLITLKHRYPSMKIHAFNVLMRSSISTLSTDAIKYWSMVNEYSQLVHKAELWGKATDIASKDQLEQSIPNDILETFRFSRQRNHTINHMSIEFVRDGLFESLSILQEDSSEYGVHKSEQRALMDFIEQEHLNNQVSIHNGTDEAGCLTVAKVIAQDRAIKTTLSYIYLNDNRDSFVASYEDRPFHQNLLSHARTANIELHDDDSADDVLVIYTPKDKQFEAGLGEGTPPCDYTAEQLNQFGKVVADLVKRGKRVYFLDVAYANGGQGEILRMIHRHTDVMQLCGYSAWNTASNALGTILAQIVLSRSADETANNRFTMERLLDDFAYQGVVRQQLKQRLLEKGEDILRLTDKSAADAMLQQLMDEFVASEDIFKAHPVNIQCKLLWPRIFEAEIFIS